MYHTTLGVPQGLRDELALWDQALASVFPLLGSWLFTLLIHSSFRWSLVSVLLP